MQLRVHDLGGEGTPAILVHGASFVARMLAPLAAGIAAQLSCHALDLRGHGASGFPDPPRLDWHDLAGDLLAVIEELGLGLDPTEASSPHGPRPVGIGHSAGGAALLLAEITRPGSFSFLYLYEPVVPLPDHAGLARAAALSLLAERARNRRDHFSSLVDARAHLASRMPYCAMADACLEAFLAGGVVELADGSAALACPGEREALYYLTSQSNDAYPHLQAISCPVTLAYGALSTGLARDAIEPVAGALRRCRVARLEGLDHLGPYIDPEHVARSVLESLRDQPMA